MSDGLRTAKFRDRRLFSQNKYWIHFYSISSKIQGLNKKIDKKLFWILETIVKRSLSPNKSQLNLFFFHFSPSQFLPPLINHFKPYIRDSLYKKNKRSPRIIKIELQLFGSRWNFHIKFLYFLGVYRLIICDLVLFVKPSKTSTTSLITSKLIAKDRIRI